MSEKSITLVAIEKKTKGPTTNPIPLMKIVETLSNKLNEINSVTFAGSSVLIKKPTSKPENSAKSKVFVPELFSFGKRIVAQFIP